MDNKNYSGLEYEDIQARFEHLEFKQELLFNNSNVDRLLFQYDIKKADFYKIMDLMDEFRDKIRINKEKVSYIDFENKILNLLNRDDINYKFCEFLTKAFMEEKRWEEVFLNLYGDRI